jgi:2-iminobutanoate/2-iminopropanoate deaminase
MAESILATLGNTWLPPAIGQVAFIATHPRSRKAGIAPVDFAYQIFRTLNLYSDMALEAWYALFKNGDASKYHNLVKACRGWKEQFMRNVVCTGDAPNAIGPYSQAAKGGGFIFVSGQLALNPATRQLIEGDARQQTEHALQNIAAALKAAGSTMDKVMGCRVFLKNMGDFEAMNDVYGKIFGLHPPARTTVEVARLPKDSLVEIDAIALE